MNDIEPKRCKLHLAADGSEQACAHEACAFWEQGGAVVSGGCLIERLGVELDHRNLGPYLLEVRERVEQVRDRAEAEQAHLEFASRLGDD